MTESSDPLKVTDENFNEVKTNVKNAEANEKLFEKQKKEKINPKENVFYKEGNKTENKETVGQNLFTSQVEVKKEEQPKENTLFNTFNVILIGAVIVVSYTLYVITKYRRKKHQLEIENQLNKPM